MSEEIVEDMLEEVAPQAAGDYLEIAQRYKLVKSLRTKSSTPLPMLRFLFFVPSFRISTPPTLLSMSMRATRATDS